MRALVACVFACASAACVPPAETPEPEPAPAPTASVTEPRARSMGRLRKAPPSPAPSADAPAPPPAPAPSLDLARYAEETRQMEARNRATDCASDRVAREVEMQKRLDSVAYVNRFIDWEDEHCKVHDNSKPVVRVVQDARGEYHTVERRDRGVDLVCDAKKPPEIAKIAARRLPVYEIPYDVSSKNALCRGLDVASSAVARAFWGVGE